MWLFEIRFPHRFEKSYFAEIRFPCRYDILIDLEFWTDFLIDLSLKGNPTYTVQILHWHSFVFSSPFVSQRQDLLTSKSKPPFVRICCFRGDTMRVANKPEKRHNSNRVGSVSRNDFDTYSFGIDLGRHTAEIQAWIPCAPLREKANSGLLKHKAKNIFLTLLLIIKKGNCFSSVNATIISPQEAQYVLQYAPRSKLLPRYEHCLIGKQALNNVRKVNFFMPVVFAYHSSSSKQMLSFCLMSLRAHLEVAVHVNLCMLEV